MELLMIRSLTALSPWVSPVDGKYEPPREHLESTRGPARSSFDRSLGLGRAVNHLRDTILDSSLLCLSFPHDSFDPTL